MTDRAAARATRELYIGYRFITELIYVGTLVFRSLVYGLAGAKTSYASMSQT